MISSTCRICTYGFICIRFREEESILSRLWIGRKSVTGERIQVLFEDNVPGHINASCGPIKAPKTSVIRAVSEEHTQA
jgi:hypothetical protein